MAKNPTLMKIREIELETHKLEALLEFYQNTLGLTVLNRSERAFSVQVGRSVLRFLKTDSGEEPYYHFAFNIPENQLPEAQQWLEKRGELMPYEGKVVVDFPNWNAHSVYFYDPAGNVVELIARHDLRNATTVPFGPQSLLGVSEIGLPVEEVTKTTELVQKALGLGFFRNYQSDTFNALGDDEGLLLIVSQNRHWFPTEKDSKLFPAKVVLEGSKSLSLAPLPYEIKGVQ